MKPELWVLGELALHCFVPIEEAQNGGPLSPLQLGGGAGMAARHLARSGTRFSTLTFSGGDALGKWLGGWLEDLTPEPIHCLDAGRRTSVVYLLHGAELDGLRVRAGSARPEALLSRLPAFAPDALVLCPYFPGFEELAARLSELPVRAILDFGHFGNFADAVKTIQLVRVAPPTWAAQLSGAPLSRDERRAVLDTARDAGFPRAFLTAGSEPVLAYDRKGAFSIEPEGAKPVCAIGAGDVFVAEVAAAVVAGASFREACAAGCRAATLKCGAWGIPEAILRAGATP